MKWKVQECCIMLIRNFVSRKLCTTRNLHLYALFILTGWRQLWHLQKQDMLTAFHYIISTHNCNLFITHIRSKEFQPNKITKAYCYVSSVVQLTSSVPNWIQESTTSLCLRRWGHCHITIIININEFTLRKKRKFNWESRLKACMPLWLFQADVGQTLEISDVLTACQLG